MKLITILLVGFTMLTTSAYARNSTQAPSMQKVGPGIWRIRCGVTEQFTPLTYRSAPARNDGPDCDHLPFPVDQISFSVGNRGCSITLPLSKDEHIYGLGLNTKLFDLMGRRAFVIPSDHPEADTNESHAPVPFYVSTKGYGVYVDTARFTAFHVGDVTPVAAISSTPPTTAPIATSTDELYQSKHAGVTMLIDIPAAQGVDVYLFGGPTLLDAVKQYNLFSGGGCVPPLSGLGIAYRGLGKFTADESLHLVRSFREQHIPCDTWGVEPGWQTQVYSSSFVWDQQRFPDPDGFIRQMHEAGYHVNFWQHAFTSPVSPMYSSLLPWSGNYRVWGGLVPDFATTQARRIFLEHNEKVLFSKGADAVKLDECDYQPFTSRDVWSFPLASVFPSGLDGEQMHSLIGVLYQQTMMQPYEHRNLRTWGLVRNSHALAASLPYTVYSDSYDYAYYVRGLAKCGFSGLLWTPEVRDAKSVEELYRRIQAVIFSPYAMVNCWYMRLPPWVQMDPDKSNAGIPMSDAEQTIKVVRKLFELRMSLIPYLYSAFNEYHTTGTPPVRAMVMDWPDDPATAALDDQFMFGPSILVAPVLPGKTGRDVYLPAGDWYNYYTHEKITGGRKIAVSPPIEQIPLFVKANSLLPLATPVEHVAADTCFDLTVNVFGDHPAPFTLYEDDGITNDYAKGKQSLVTLSWNGAGGSSSRTRSYTGPVKYKITEWYHAGAGK